MYMYHIHIILHGLHGLFPYVVGFFGPSGPRWTAFVPSSRKHSTAVAPAAAVPLKWLVSWEKTQENG